MQDTPSLFSRPDTFFGVCEALGQDFGLPPLLFRLAFAFGVFWNPLAAIGVYLLLGLTVALARRLFPASSAAPPVEESHAEPAAQNDDAAPALAEAA